MPACLNHVFYFGETEYAQPFFFSFSQETLICPSADLVRGWKYPNFCFLAVFYFLTGPHPDEITYLHAGNVRKELKIILFRSVNLWQSPCKEISTTCYFTCSPFPHFATVRPGSPATPLYVKERWILLLFNSFSFRCGVLDFMDDTVWMWNPLI